MACFVRVCVCVAAFCTLGMRSAVQRCGLASMIANTLSAVLELGRRKHLAGGCLGPKWRQGSLGTGCPRAAKVAKSAAEGGHTRTSGASSAAWRSTESMMRAQETGVGSPMRPHAWLGSRGRGSQAATSSAHSSTGTQRMLGSSISCGAQKMQALSRAIALMQVAAMGRAVRVSSHCGGTRMSYSAAATPCNRNKKHKAAEEQQTMGVNFYTRNQTVCKSTTWCSHHPFANKQAQSYVVFFVTCCFYLFHIWTAC